MPVVDQASTVAEKLRALVAQDQVFRHALGLGERDLSISTLRGQHVDNRQWLETPSLPAIIVGTVDKIGSALLFRGYGVSNKMRAYHAGLLGSDSLIVLDEAHLVPPFEALLASIADGTEIFGPRSESLRRVVPPMTFMSLSATGRKTDEGRAFGLGAADIADARVRRRLDAKKGITILPAVERGTLAEALAREAWDLSQDGQAPVRVVIFTDRRETAAKAKQALEAHGEVDAQLFVGERRVRERLQLKAWLERRGFIGGNTVALDSPAFVFATSAGEVGVDMDADHMVGDIVAWERIVQRLGRVNRRGEGDAAVRLIVEDNASELRKVRGKEEEKYNAKDRALLASVACTSAVQEIIGRLPQTADGHDASPGAIRELRLRAKSEPDLSALIEQATTRNPVRPPLSRATVDAWSMTSLEKHTGRPDVRPWLRGWIPDDPPQTTIIWRTYLPVRSDGSQTNREVTLFFEAAPPHLSEELEVDTYKAVDWLTVRARKLSVDSKVLAMVLDTDGTCQKSWTRADLVAGDNQDEKAWKEAIEAALGGATLIVDAGVAGLTTDGLLEKEFANAPETMDRDADWLPRADTGDSRIPPFRILHVAEFPPEDLDWHDRFRFKVDEDEESSRWLIVQKWRGDSTTEEDRSEGRLQTLERHQRRVRELVIELASRLDLPPALTEVLEAAADTHDEGKRAALWQRAFNVPDFKHVYAKTPGPIKYALLNGYRHEFGSLGVPVVQRKLHEQLEFRDLGFHEIAAHHGFARPVIGINGCEDSPPSVLEARAREVAVRFARLQREWGPWGLAWIEALFRSADQQASRENDAGDALQVTEQQ